jgi:hypothetical protein
MKMTPEILTDNYLRVRKEFYGLPGILKRLPNNLAHPLVYLGINAGLRSTVKEDARAVAASRASQAARPTEAARFP